MLVAIIEFETNDGAGDEFSGIVQGLQGEIGSIDGFISADPAQSIVHDGLMYEVSYWRDREAIAAWAANTLHQDAMKQGRERLLKWYRIRIGEIERDWTHGNIPSSSPAAQAAP